MFKFTVHPEDGEKLDEVLIDIITSAAFFKKKEIEIENDDNGFSFTFRGYCPNEYFLYLNAKYDASFDYIFTK